MTRQITLVRIPAGTVVTVSYTRFISWAAFGRLALGGSLPPLCAHSLLVSEDSRTLVRGS